MDRRLPIVFIFIISITWQPVISVTHGCYEVDKLARVFYEPPENRDPDQLTQLGCQISCAQYDYAFAAVEEGNICLCSVTNTYLPANAFTSTSCNAPCTGDGAETCGGIGYCEVFDSLNTPITVNLTTGVTFIVGVSGSITVTSTGYEPEFTFDFGDGVAVTEPIKLLTQSHIYAIPGYYSVKCTAENGFLAGDEDTTDVLVQMQIDADGLDLVCPIVEDLNNDFDMTLTVFKGSEMLVDVDMDGDTLNTTAIGSPAMYSIGFIAQDARADLMDGTLLNSGSTVWVLPRLEILQPGYIMSVEAYVTTPGTVNILILKPLCSGADIYCPQNNNCDVEANCNYDFAYKSNPLYTDYCGTTGVYCAMSGTCKYGGVCSPKDPRYDESGPRTDYKVMAAIPVTFTVTNASQYFQIPIADIIGGTLADIGFVIGYETNAAGFGWQNITNNTIEYQYSGVAYSTGSVLDVADALVFETQHYLRVSLVKELLAVITYAFPTYGEHPVTVDVRNSLTTETKTCTVTIQQNITGLELTMINHTVVDSTEEATLFVWLERGIPAALYIDWGDGSTPDEVDRVSTSPDVPDNITHSFEAAGNLTITVNASNLWNYEVFEFNITVYNPVDLAAYDIVTNSPQPNGLGDVKGVITTVVTYNNAAVKAPTFVDVSISGGYAFDEVVYDDIYDITSIGQSCSLKISFTYSGEYTLKLVFSNLLNSEEYEVLVEITDVIYNFSVTPRHIPVQEQYRDAEDANLVSGTWHVPIEVPTLFTASVLQGSNLQYTYFDFGDGVAATTFDDVYSHSYLAIGDYTVTVQANNSVSSTNVSTLNIKVESSVRNIVVDEGPLAGQNDLKYFTIKIGQVGNNTCIVFDYGDGTPRQFYGTPIMCSGSDDYVAVESTTINTEIDISHAYTEEKSYVLRIEAYNFVSTLMEEYPFAITTLNCHVPDIIIRNHQPDITLPSLVNSKDVLIISTQTIINCEETVENIKSWNLTKVTPNGIVERVIDLASLNPEDQFYTAAYDEADIRFDKFKMDVGIYKFIYTVEMLRSETEPVVFVSSMTHFVNVQKLPLNIAGVEGQVDRLSIGMGQLLELSPYTYSTDPNIDQTFSQGIETFQIFCRRKTENWPSGNINDDVLASNGKVACMDLEEDEFGGCFCGGPGMIFPENGTYLQHTNYTLNTTRMISEIDYEIVLKGIKGENEGLRYLELRLTESTPPQPIIRIADGTPFSYSLEPSKYGQVLNSDTDIRVIGECVQPCNITSYKWKLRPGNETGYFEVSWDDYDSKPTGIQTSTLYISRELVEQSLPVVTRYEIELVATDSDGVDGVAAIRIGINIPPDDGTCTCESPTTLTVGESVNITCDNWYDADGIGEYKVYTKNSLSTTDSFLFTQETGKLNHLKPPTGPESDDYKLELHVEIRDKLKSSTRLKVCDIFVRPPSTEEAEAILEELDNKLLSDDTPYENLKAGGDTMSIVVAVLLDGGSLNGIRDVTDKSFDEQTESLLNSTTTESTATEAKLSELSDLEESERNKRAQICAVLVDTLTYATVKSVQDITQIASAFVVVTNSSDEISDDAIKAGLEIVGDMVSQLIEFSSDTNQNELEEAGLSVISALGNLIEGSTQSIDNPLSTANGYISPSSSLTSTAGTTADPQAMKDRNDKARNAVNTFMANLDTVSETLGNNKVPGEPPTAIVTPKITVQLMKDYAHLLGNETTNEGAGSFDVGAWCGGILPKTGCDDEVVIVRQSMSIIINPYNFDESSEQIPDYATTMSFTFRTGSNDEISVQNSPAPIQIFCPRIGTPEPELELYVPSEYNETAYFCHGIEIKENKTAFMFDFRPEEQSLYYAIMLQYETKPNITHYDHIWFFGFNETGFDDVNKDDSIYSVFLSDSYVGYNAGKYQLCISEVTPIADTSDIIYDATIDEDIELFDVGDNVIVQLNNVSYNYSLVISTTGCKFWDEDIGMWSSEGCWVGTESNLSTTECFCNHLTSFASSWFVPPAPLDFDYIFANAGFLDNITIYCTTIAIYVIFVIIFIWARRKDKKDVLKLGVTPLPDNAPTDRYFYEITVLTGQRKAAGTDSNVHFILSGEDDETDVRCFEDDQRKVFRRGGVDRFLLAVRQPLGALNYIRIWHDNAGKGKMQGWYLKYIVIKDLQVRKRYYFIVNRWFSVVEDDGQIDRLIAVAGKDEMQEFSHVFSNHTRKNLNDGHLWFSILSRPVGNRFTRLQRAGCCLMALWLEMLVSIMFYKVIPPAGSENPVKIGPLTITPASVMIGLESSLLVFPISLLVVNFFRKSRPRKKRKSRIMAAYEKQSKAFQKKNKLDRNTLVTPSAVKFSNLDGEDLQEVKTKPHKSKNDEQLEPIVVTTTASVPVKKKKKKVRFGFPWWCIIIAWILTILSTATATVFVIFYGIQLGNDETSMWLASLFISFFTAILFTQPIKVVLIAVFIACIMKTPGAEQEEDMDDDEEEFYLKTDEEWLHLPVEGRSRKITYQPQKPEDLERAREQRLKEIKMFSIFREICFYSFFVIILMVVSYGNTNSMAYDVKSVLSSNIQGPINNFNKITTREMYWSWLRDVLVPSLQVPDWYNGQAPKENWYFSDRHSLILGYAVVRQQRVIPDLCDPHEYFEDIVNTCNVAYSVGDSDVSNYGAEWTKYNETLKHQAIEFQYTDWDVLDSYPFLGRHGLYSGGGYIIDLSGDIDYVQSRIDKLHSQHWIDKHTRAIFVEFSVYNAEVNLFGVINMLVEFLPTGSLYPTERIDVIHLLRTYHGFAMFVIISEGIFIGFMIFFIVKEINNFRREGKKYFSKFWNWIEFLIISISIAGVVLYFYRHVVSKELVEKFKENGSKEYIKLQYVANWNEVFMYMLGTVVFLGTTKFLKLLRFNRRMALLSTTLRACAKDLFYFGIMFFVVFFAFVSIFYQLFVTILFDFSDVVYTMESLIGTLLGAFDFESISTASGLLGPIFFFLYMAFMPFLLINMFLTILNESFTEVKHDNDQQANDYEMVDFIMRHFKGLLGMNKARDLLHEKNNKDVDKTPATEIEEKISEFPSKVDQLLDTIAKVYFDAQKFDDIISKMGGGPEEKPKLKKKLNKNINFVA
ncbi:polycystin-1-like [Antedon mediterranea]|uniref:polycystin-1-like n=1 Tax=Antedon mediterranea TaxID=105859 RepID=UPI003AF55971